jgi:Family of unknown function (DUF6712)
MALFNTTSEIKNHLSINLNTKFENLKPVLNRVEEKYIQDILGDTEYTSLESAYQSLSLSAEQTKLLEKCQDALANLTYLYYASTADINVSDIGFTVQSTEQLAPASQWRVENFKSDIARDGYNGLEVLLKFLWANDTDYPDWKASTNNKEYRQFFINTATEFTRYYNIGRYFQLFTELRSTIRHMERLYIRPVISEAYFDELKAEILADTVSADNDLILDEFIKPALANLSIAHGAKGLAIDITSAGIFEHSKSDRGNIMVTTSASGGRLASALTEANILGKTYLNRLRKYLNENASASKYATYFNSDKYVAPVEDTHDPYDVSTSKTFKF